jgi:uncharacterized membrane protein YccC
MKRGSEAGLKALRRLKEDHLLGVHFAINVFIASTITWVVLELYAGVDPVWAMASMVASSEPVPGKAFSNFRSRLINTLVGCAVGLVFILVGEPRPWKLPTALAIAVLLSSYIVKIPVMWRQAPITAAIVVAGGVMEHSRISGLDLGLRRIAEVIFGCLIGMLVSWIMYRLWPMKPEPPTP